MEICFAQQLMHIALSSRQNLSQESRFRWEWEYSTGTCNEMIVVFFLFAKAEQK